MCTYYPPRTANHFIIAHSILNIFLTQNSILHHCWQDALNISESATRPRIRPGLCNTIFLLDSYILEWPITLSTSFRAKTCLGNVNEAMNNLDRNILHHNGCSSRRWDQNYPFHNKISKPVSGDGLMWLTIFPSPVMIINGPKLQSWPKEFW